MYYKQTKKMPRRLFGCYVGGFIAFLVFAGLASLAIMATIRHDVTTHECTGEVANQWTERRCWVSECDDTIHVGCPFTNCESWGATITGQCCGNYVCLHGGTVHYHPCNGEERDGFESRQWCTMTCEPVTIYSLRFSAAGKEYYDEWWCNPSANCNSTLIDIELEHVLRPRRCYLSDGKLSEGESDKGIGYFFLSMFLCGIALAILFFTVTSKPWIE